MSKFKKKQLDGQIDLDKKSPSLFLWTVIFFFLICIYCFYQANFPKAVFNYGDELRYFDIPRSLLTGRGMQIHNAASDFQKILYPLCLVPAFLFKNREISLIVISVINSLLMGLGIFPVYLLAKKMLMNKRTSIFMLVLYLSVSELCYADTFMSENLYLPLSMFTIYIFYLFINRQYMGRQRKVCAVLTGMLTYLLYLNKEIALAFILAYLVYAVYSIIREKDKAERKNIGIDFALFLVGFVLLFILFKITLFRGMGNSYNQMNLDILKQNGRIGYMMYSFFAYLLAFGMMVFIFPVLLPIIGYRDIDQKQKNFFIFLILTVIFSCAVIAYTISVREDFPSLTLRLHMRYFTGFFIPFIILMLSVLEKKALLKPGRVAFSVFIVWLAIFFIYQGFRTSGVDQTCFNYIWYFQNSLGENGILVFKFAAMLFVLILAACLLLGKEKFKAVFLIIVFSIEIMNTVITGQKFRSFYFVDKAQVAAVQKAAEFVRSNKGEKFVAIEYYKDGGVISTGSRLMDTYLDQDNVYTVSADDYRKGLGNTGFDLNKATLVSAVFRTPYASLKKVDYLIIPKELKLTPDQNACDMVSDLGQYKVYKPKNTAVLPNVH